MGVLISTALYTAPARDLQTCLQKGSLGTLNPIPWAVMSGNCLGWLIYAHLAHDPFILASNVPGILISTWLNVGASKLQHIEAMGKQHNNTTSQQPQQQHQLSETTTIGVNGANNNSDSQSATTTTTTTIPTLTSQDSLWLKILSLWLLIVIGVIWLPFLHTFQGKKETIGLLVNINLLFFYGSPLQTMKTVVATKNSDSIHTMTVLLNCVNAAFWAAYGIAVHDMVVYGPNGIGLLLGLLQALLCCMYPKSSHHHRRRRHGNSSSLLVVDVDTSPLLAEEEQEQDGNIEDAVDTAVSDNNLV